MNKVLLVDTNISSFPIYNFLVEAGYDVTVIGGNPQDFLAKTAAQYIEADYSEPETLASVVDRHGFDFIVPGCNDRSYLACALLNVDGRFPGLDTLASAETINNKQLFRDFSLANGLPVPRVYAPEAYPINQSLIVKPVDAFSGRGVTILHTPDPKSVAQAQIYANNMSRSGLCIIEDYVEGQLYSHSCFLQEGNLLVEFIVEEHGTANPFVVDTSRVVHDFPPQILKALHTCIERMAQVLGMGDGLIHTQFILQGNEFWLIEITRRCPGDLYSQLIELSTGVPYAGLYARPFVGLPYLVVEKVPATSWIMRHTMSLPESGILGALHFNCPIMLERMYPLCVAGDALRASPFGRIALLFIRASSLTELESVFALTLKRELYSVGV
jgi:hypothetical protein